MSDPNVHVGTHPTGHPNKTAVNADNPIFGRPADPIPAVSIQQAAVVQSEKHPRETVQSPLINEAAVTSTEPSVEDLGAMQAAGEKQSEDVTSHEHEMEAAGYPPAAKVDPVDDAEKDAPQDSEASTEPASAA